MVWTKEDATSASATITDGPVSVTMLFRFGADGLIASIHVDPRAMQVAGVRVARGLPKARFAPWVEIMLRLTGPDALQSALRAAANRGGR